MIKEILKYDIVTGKEEKILKMKTKQIVDFNDDIVRECITNLNETLSNLINKYGKTRGIGLSAPQIGYSLAISIIQLGENRYTLINPKIVRKSKETRLFRIGCFSLYQYRALINYPENVTVEYYDENEKKLTLDVSGDWALIVQHEIDHLSGILLFDRLPNKEKDLFIPREYKYTKKHVPLKNYGFVFEIRRRLGIVSAKNQTTTQYYSFLFNDSYDYNEYIKRAVIKRRELIDVILKYNALEDKILEAGCGTSSLSIYLSKLGYKLYCVELDKDMFKLAKRINAKANGSVQYYNQDITKLEFNSASFQTIYSHGVLEHFDNKSLIKAIEEGFKVAKYYIISVPTIWDISNNLMGDEKLYTIHHWKKIFKKQGYNILELVKMFPEHPKLKKINRILDVFPSGNVIFVLEKKN